MFKSNAIQKELEELITVHENGDGFGDLDAKADAQLIKQAKSTLKYINKH